MDPAKVTKSVDRVAVLDYNHTNTLHMFRKRRLTDKNLPASLSKHESFASESKMYTDLLEMERKLDWTMTRKRVEVQDVIGRQPSVSPMFNTCSSCRVYIRDALEYATAEGFHESYGLGSSLANCSSNRRSPAQFRNKRRYTRLAGQNRGSAT